jgi:hypothetical protein
VAYKRTHIRALFSLVIVLICVLLSILTNKEPDSETEQRPAKSTPQKEAPSTGLTNKEGLSKMLEAVETLPIWEQSGTPQYAQGDDLFVLINGGAEIYLEYGFEKAALANFKDSNGKSIIVEIYEMSSSEAAYGMYTFKTDKEAKVLDIGGEAKQSGYYLNLWKNNYVITLTGADPKADTSASLQRAARSLSTTGGFGHNRKTAGIEIFKRQHSPFSPAIQKPWPAHHQRRSDSGFWGYKGVHLQV